MSTPHAHGSGRHHDHHWHLADGTGLHAPIGTLVRDPQSGQACCHVCGEFFTFLGAHIRVHGYSAAGYRAAMGLGRTTPLTAPTLSDEIARRQKRAYDTSPQGRANLSVGHAMARSGQLATLATNAHFDPRPEADAARSRALAAGRSTQSAARSTEMEQRLSEHGAADAETFARGAYESGCSLDEVAGLLGIGRQSVRSILDATGTPRRSVGANTADGKRARVRSADRAVAERLGIDDLAAWLIEQRRNGTSLAQLGRLVGHSSHWVRWRLEAVS